MKNILVFAAVALAGSSVISGCYKQTDYPPTVYATIGSLSFSASGKIDVTSVADTSKPKNITVKAVATNFTPGTGVKPVITFVVPNAVGVYTINLNATANLVSAAGGGNAAYGTVTVINNADGKLQGGFSFTCYDSTKVTDGHFQARIPG